VVLPLKGLVVVDFSRLLPGPYATMLLADLGARVIKIEEPGVGDPIRHMPPIDPGLGTSAKYWLLNRRKESVALHLKTPEGREAAIRLAERADVLVEGFRPGVMDRLGLSYDSLSRVNPRLIYCSITGYGHTGPYRETVGHDLNYLAMAGVLSLSGGADGPPDPPGVQVADIGGGALMAVVAILAALLQRQVTGRGQFLDVSMVDGLISWLSIHAADTLLRGRGPAVGERTLGGDFACYRAYETADGRYLTVAAVEPVFWKNLCEAVGLQRWVDAQYAPDPVRTEVIRDFEALFRRKTLEKWMAELGPLEVCVAPVLDVREALTGSHATARGLVAEDASGRRYVRFPVLFAGMESGLAGGVPSDPDGTAESGLGQPTEDRAVSRGSAGPERYRVGSDTEVVLREIGYSPDEIAEMRRRGAIA
jgi:crotonobetainyl-CoA:carnitine CoA-transferase CaiB-like acyl-CoA transferase